MHGHKNIPSANPLFAGIIMSSPYSPHNTIRVNVRSTKLSLQVLVYTGAQISVLIFNFIADNISIIPTSNWKLLESKLVRLNRQETRK